MNQKELKDAVNRYNERLQQFGVSEQALGWGQKGRAKLRFEILISQWNLNGQSVLDFGCGFGDLYAYLSEKGIQSVNYNGVDINPNFIEIARNRYENTANFILKNILEDSFTEKYDFILSSGVFNHKLDDNMGFIKKSFEKFNALSKKGFAVNFLSDKVAFKYDYTYHANPAEILELAYKYSNNVVLRNDYMPYEFTVFINKFSPVNKDFTVYEDYVKYV